MPFAGTQITVDTTGTTILVAGDGTVTDPVPAVITNQHATASVYLGASGVTNTGYELKAGQSLSLALMAGEVLYAASGAGTVRVDVLKGRQ